MKLSTITEARYAAHGPGTISWFIRKFCDLKHRASEDNPTNEYEVRDDFHVYTKDAKRVTGVETWQTPEGDMDWGLLVAPRPNIGGISSYSSIDNLTIYKVEKVWGPDEN